MGTSWATGGGPGPPACAGRVEALDDADGDGLHRVLRHPLDVPEGPQRLDVARHVGRTRGEYVLARRARPPGEPPRRPGRREAVLAQLGGAPGAQAVGADLDLGDPPVAGPRHADDLVRPALEEALPGDQVRVTG